MSEIKNDPVIRRIEGCYIENTIKYICRWKKKNDLKDLKKARQYLDWLIEIEDPHMTEEDVKRELNRIYGEIIWTEFCRIFCEVLNEVSEEEKEKKNEK